MKIAQSVCGDGNGVGQICEAFLSFIGGKATHCTEGKQKGMVDIKPRAGSGESLIPTSLYLVGKAALSKEYKRAGHDNVFGHG